MLKKVLIGLLIFIVVVIGVAAVTAFPIVSGYSAKNLCSHVFVSGREAQDVIDKELGNMPLAIGSPKIDLEDQSASATVFGLAKKKAIYRPGLGCTLINSVEEEDLRAESFNKPSFPYDKDTAAWPVGDIIVDSLISSDVQQAIGQYFNEPLPEAPRYTRGVVVVHKGQIVAEGYAPGFDMYTPQLSWSMAKSFTNALVGLLVKEGKLNVYDRAPVDAWADPEDPRNAITLDHLMRMSSGLDWSENYSLPSGATNMLFKDASMAATAAAVDLAYPPDSVWYYSSGTTNIISEIVRNAVGDEAYWAYPYHELFHKIGISTATFEPDASGTFVGSSYLWMSPRDYARFGLLYLNDGVWEGERILPEGWVDYSSAPTPSEPMGIYGAQFWRNGKDGHKNFPDVPQDAYLANGYEGQRIMIIPSMDLVVVRLGYTATDDFDMNGLVRDVIAALD
jgi:CubicO group peptidase (beta-lactamase class C family)